MSDIDKADVVHTRIWREEPEPGNDFATRAAYVRGYDVYGQMLGRASWIQMLVLLLRDELPSSEQLQALETLAVGLANPGPRDPSVHAAMCGGVGGSAAAASLMAALAVGAGRTGGARDVLDAIRMWSDCGMSVDAWQANGGPRASDPVEAFPDREHTPGFDPNGTVTPTVVRQLLAAVASGAQTPRTTWLHANLDALTHAIGKPLAMSGVAAALFADLGFTGPEGEMLFLLLRLPGAAAHALEQQHHGYRRFPFYQIDLQSEQAP
ncbi:citryl-CoA lyase [Massilia arenosa]|uniref:Citryl-CoA lyase n=1 Tax=Zemynaea arenosa TaxID=2561931 RepID=A0A4Y9RUM7_9BURK|nr:citryl-CoA lyase [Massilia arenosa]TFW11535.1 citryl-CoA lyase [Massilia arenosa]